MAAMRVDLDDEPLALLLADVDNFSTLNDYLGHHAGDAMLQVVSDILRSVESVDVAAFRLGGDEFVLWARGFSLEHAHQLTEDINRQLREKNVAPDYQEQPLFLSLTWGVVSSPTPQLEAMIRQAEELIYAAKPINRRDSIN